MTVYTDPVIVAVCRNCGKETAKADLGLSPRKIWWQNAEGENLMGWDFCLKPCCGDRANTAIDIVVYNRGVQDTTIGDVCVLCDTAIIGFGNNARPLADGRCCDDCNSNLVLPYRIVRASRAIRGESE